MTDVKKRAGHRSLVTKLITEARVLLSETSLDRTKLQSKIAVLKKQQTQIDALNDVIQATLEPDDLVTDMEECTRREEELLQVVLIIEETLKQISNNSVSNKTLNNLKLPQIVLPTFDGNPINWPSFWDCFYCTVHDRTDLPNVQKLAYFTAQLKGEALTLLSGFPLVNESYPEVIQLAKDTFGRPNRIITAHLHNLFDIPDPTCNVADLRRFRSAYESSLRSLKTLKTKIDEAGFVVAALLLRKLPPRVRDNINRSNKTNYFELSEFRAAMDAEIEHLQALNSSNAGPELNLALSDARNGHSKIKNKNVSSNMVMTEKSNSSNGMNKKSSKNNFVKNMNKNYKNNEKFMSSSNESRDAYFGPRQNTGMIGCQLCTNKHAVGYCNIFNDAKSRIKRAAELKLCKRCLNVGHRSVDCKSAKICNHCNLNNHHYALCLKHFSSPRSKNETPQETNPEVEPRTTASTAIAATATRSHSVALPIATVPIITDAGVFNVRALIDQGAQRTFIKHSTALKLSLKLFDSIILTIDGFALKGEPKNYDIVQFKVATLCGTVDSQAIIVEELPTRITAPGLTDTANRLINAGFKLADNYESDTVDDVSLLIGSDQYYNFVTGFSKFDGINLIHSNLGYIISGNIPCPINSENEMVTTDIITVLRVGVDINNEIPLGDEIRRLWTLDSIGICETETTKEEKLTLQNFEQSISYENGHYTARLPWRPEHPPLPTNFCLAKARLKSLQKKLQNDGMLSHYSEVINNQLIQQFIERVEMSQVSDESKIHYLAHHGVKKDSPTTPLRVVFDCSAKLGPGKPSLNDCLYTGPSLIHELIQVLLRFRLYNFAAVSDIAKAFLMISLHKDDRDSTRFLWFEDPTNPNSKLIVYRFRVVLFGATCSQFLLNATIKYHLKLNPGTISSNIERNIYVDNLQSTFNTDQELVDFYESSKKLLSAAGLTLQEWDTNSPKLKSKINTFGDGVKQTRSAESGSGTMGDVTNVLGLSWDTNDDFLGFPHRNVLIEGDLTKRKILRSIATIFDPIGLITPITIRSRIYIQSLWKANMSWDEVITSKSLIDDWNNIQSDMHSSLSFSFPRKVLSNIGNVDIHAFADASMAAYGTVIYMTENGQPRLLMSKARVAPLKTKSVPRLELLATLLAARLINYVCQAFKDEFIPKQLHIWTDSQVCLRWLTSAKPLETFIRNRVDEIKDLLPQVNLHYVKTKDNPADLLTRGISFKSFIKSDLWISGPEWLSTPELWPTLDETFSNLTFETLPTLTMVAVNPQHIKQVNTLIDVSRFGSLKKLYNVIMLVFKFINLFIVKSNYKLIDVTLESAENLMFRQVQEEAYRNEVDYLQCNVGKTPMIVKQLNLFMVNGLIRCKGRIEHSNLNYNMKFPLLMPAKHPFTVLLIRDAHTKRLHGGVNDVVAYLRQRFWVPTIRQRVKSELRSCVVCKRLQGSHYATPPEAPLPAVRLQESRPFQTTGVDYSGALLVKNGGISSKVYICLFTCAVTRALHLELVEDNTAESFVMAFRRFSGRRSTPLLMLSDNSTTFTSSASHLQLLQAHPSINECLRQNKCDWKFIPSRSPWMGGFWERLIGATKMCLKKMLGRSIVTSEELRTLIVEIEAGLNDRPLSYTSSSLDELEVLTPAHLLYGFRLSSLPTPIEDPNPDDELYLDRPLLTKRQLKCAKLREAFWERWRCEYLTSLRERQSKFSATPLCEPKIGDVVLIFEDSARLFWKLGIVQEIHRGVDNMVRSAKVKTANGVISRSTKHLYPLEINAEVGEVVVTDQAVDNEQPIAARTRSKKLVKLSEADEV